MKKIMILMLMGIMFIIPFDTYAYDVPIYQLDDKISELNGYTLKEVFETNQILDNNLFDKTSGWITYSFPDTNNGYFRSTLLYPNSIQSGKLVVGRKYYANAYRYPIEDNEILLNESFLQFGVNNANVIYSITNVIKGIVIFNSSSNGFYINFNNPSNLKIRIKYDYIYIIDLTNLGLTNITMDRIDHYFNLYQLALKYELDNKDAVKDDGNYKHIFMSIYEGLKGLMSSMGNVWNFLSTPIIGYEMSEIGELFQINWTWNIMDILFQLISNMGVFILQINFIFVNYLISFLGIPIKISLLSLVFSDFVFVVLGWIIIKSFII